MSHQTTESKKEEFRKYLEKAGVLDQLTKILVALYEEQEKPQNAIDFMKKYMGSPSDLDTEKLQIELDKLKEKNSKLESEAEILQKEESMNLLRMGHKMDAMSTVIKANTSNVAMIDSMNKITPLLYAQSKDIPVEKIYNDMEKFEKSMDDILVSGKVMDQVLNKNYQDSGQEVAVDNMLSQLKNEMYNEISSDLNANNAQLFNELNKPNMNTNVNNDVNFLNDLKKT